MTQLTPHRLSLDQCFADQELKLDLVDLTLEYCPTERSIEDRSLCWLGLSRKYRACVGRAPRRTYCQEIFEDATRRHQVAQALILYWTVCSIHFSLFEEKRTETY